MNPFFIDLLGWSGAFCVVLAYFLVSAHKTDSKDWRYQLLNFTGALCLIINTLYLKAYPSMVVNIIWLLIAAYYLLSKLWK